MGKKTQTTKKEGNAKSRAEIAQVVSEVLGDPDFGKELSEDAKKRLRAARNSKKSIPFSEIKKKHLD